MRFWFFDCLQLKNIILCDNDWFSNQPLLSLGLFGTITAAPTIKLERMAEDDLPKVSSLSLVDFIHGLLLALLWVYLGFDSDAIFFFLILLFPHLDFI